MSLEFKHENTHGEDLFEKIFLAMRKLNLLFEKLNGLTTDIAPVTVGSEKELTALLKKEMTNFNKKRGLNNHLFKKLLEGLNAIIYN